MQIENEMEFMKICIPHLTKESPEAKTKQTNGKQAVQIR